MTTEADRTDAVEALLNETEAAHGAYESTELNGVYDEQWPQWYAGYAMEHGIGAVLDRDISAEELARTLSAAYQEFQATDPPADEPWQAFIARRLVEGG
jgi:hypothetical protein